MIKLRESFRILVSNVQQICIFLKACTITNQTFNATHEARIDFCNATKWEFIMNSRVGLVINVTFLKVVWHYMIITDNISDNSDIRNVQACHRLQIQSKNASEICDCWDTQAAAVEVILMTGWHMLGGILKA